MWFTIDPSITISLNYSDKVEKISSILECWKLRRLSLLGKIVVLKSLVASQLVYILTSLQTDHKAINKINTLFYAFLWNGKGDKVKRKIMINDYMYPDGGLKMLDIASFNKSPRIGWVKKYLDPESSGKWKCFFDLQLVLYNDWISKGILQVKHLMEDSCNLLSLTAFQNKYSIKVQPLTFFGKTSAVNPLGRSITMNHNKYESFLSKLFNTQKPSRLAYQKLV